MSVCVLFNPAAGSAGQIDALRAALAADPLGHAPRGSAGATTSGRSPPPAGRHARRRGVAGGDGTVHAAVNGLVGAGGRAALAVLPLGTGNDFCRTMAIPLDPVEAAKAAPRGRAAGDRRDSRGRRAHRVHGERRDRRVQRQGGVRRDVELKAFWGPLAYLRGAAGTIADPPRYRLTVRFDGGPPETFDAVNVVVANARTAAGGMPVAPLANPEDGLLDVVLVLAGDTLDLSVVAARLMHGDYLDDENVVHRLARAVELDSDPPLAAERRWGAVRGRPVHVRGGARRAARADRAGLPRPPRP
jgi:diacylglycerol kinase (ATP)